jgi:taurine dioxygenase
MQLRDLSGSIGSEVLDVDLSTHAGRLTAYDIDTLRARWDDRHLLLVRGPELTGEQQLAFVGRFGRLICERRPWGYVSNVRADAVVREGALLFHSDFAFTPGPIEGISLHAVDVPADGAPTLFADASAAVTRLPASLRARLEELTVLNCFDFAQPQDQHRPESLLSPGSPRHVHPAVGVHPRTGRPVVLANQMHSDRLLGLPAKESDALLTELFAVLYDPAHLMVHRWQVGDTVLWDNIALHHGRPAPPLDQPRTLQRVTLGDYTPAELIPDLAGLLIRAKAATHEAFA